MEIKNTFFLLGYETGVIIALELASILEKAGLTGTIFCVGGSPKEIQAIVNKQLQGSETEEELQGTVARHMCKVLAADSLTELEERLQGVSTWQETLDACVVALRTRVSHPLQFSRLAIEAVYARIRQVRDYKPQPIPLRSQIVALYTRSTCRNSTQDHSLQRFSQRPVVKYDLHVSLVHAVNNPRCTKYINRHLGSEVLEAFEKKNLCQTYIPYKEKFTSNQIIPDNILISRIPM